MKEKSLWLSLKKHLRKYGTLVRIENPAHIGTPDVLYTIAGKTGLIELKSIDTLSLKAFDPAALDLSIEQQLWLRMWGESGGTAFVLVRVVRPLQYLLFDWSVVLECKLTLLSRAIIRTTGRRLPAGQIRKVLIMKR